MKLVYLFLLVSLIWLHVAALAAWAGPRFGGWATGRGMAVLAIVLAGFFIEHQVGLGSLRFAWPFSSLASAWFLWRQRRALLTRQFAWNELVFGAALAYGLAWRVLFPSIYPTSERLADLAFLSNYVGGETLPPVDHWLPPFRFDYYYSLQYYGAGLLARIFRTPTGLAYNLSIAFLSAIALSLVWETGSRFIKGVAPRLLLVAAIACGGTGVSLFSHALVDGLSGQAAGDAYPVASARFIGVFEREVNTSFGRRLFPDAARPDVEIPVLPLENFGYQYLLGEFHPPLGGYFLLLLAVALIAAMETVNKDDEKTVRRRWLTAALGLGVPVTLMTNTWVFPLQVALVGGWAAWRAWQARGDASRKPDWGALIAGGLAGFILIYPALAGFASSNATPSFRLVSRHDGTPPSPFILQFWPLLILFGLGLWNRESRRLSLFFSILFGALLLLSEFVFIDDYGGGVYERFNTVLKWWGWIWTGAFASLGALLLASRARWIRATAMLVLASTLIYARDIAQHWWFGHENGSAGLYGTDVYTSDPVAKAMFQYLAAAPDGIVLENQYGDAYHDGVVYSAFSGKPVLLGWEGHLLVLRGGMDFIEKRRHEIDGFYSGSMARPLEWLMGNDVRYVVWNRVDAQRAEVWHRWNEALSPAYAWQEFGMDDTRPIGFWVRRQ